jgi:hypothetical protein
VSENLAGALTMAILAESRDTTDRLIAVMREQIATAEAHRKAVEHGVSRLLGEDYTPFEAAIRAAVFCPPQALIDHYRQESTS